MEVDDEAACLIVLGSARVKRDELVGRDVPALVDRLAALLPRLEYEVVACEAKILAGGTENRCPILSHSFVKEKCRLFSSG
jgi:hypothetical protein